MFELATIKLRLSKHLIDTDIALAKSIEGSQSLQMVHEYPASMLLSSMLLLQAGRLYRNIEADKETKTEWKHLDVKRFWTTDKTSWISEAESWSCSSSEKVCTVFMRSMALSMKSGTHDRRTLRSVCMELTSVLGRESTESLRTRAAYYLTCGSDVSRMLSCLDNEVNRLGSETLSDVSKLDHVILYRCLQSMWSSSSSSSPSEDDQNVLQSKTILRSLMYLHHTLKREQQYFHYFESRSNLISSLHKTLLTHKLYRNNCCFDSVPDDIETLKSDMKDRVCIQWQRNINNSSEEDEIGLFALLGPTQDEERPELVHRAMSAKAVQKACKCFGRQLRVLENPEIRNLMIDKKEDMDLIKSLKKSLKYEFLPGLNAVDHTSGLDFEDVDFVKSLSKALNVSLGVDVRNSMLCEFMRNVLLSM